MFLNPALYTRAQAYDPMAGLGDEISEVMNYKRGVYDFAVLGGVQSVLNLKDEQGITCVIPNASLVTSVIFDFITAVTSAGAATMSFGLNSAVDLLAATAKASLTGLLAGIPVGTAATAVKVASGTTLVQRANFATAGKLLTTTIATADLTAGKCYVHLQFARSSAT